MPFVVRQWDPLHCYRGSHDERNCSIGTQALWRHGLSGVEAAMGNGPCASVASSVDLC
jgi:hypothetical protein